MRSQPLALMPKRASDRLRHARHRMLLQTVSGGRTRRWSRNQNRLSSTGVPVYFRVWDVVGDSLPVVANRVWRAGAAHRTQPALSNHRTLQHGETAPRRSNCVILSRVPAKPTGRRPEPDRPRTKGDYAIQSVRTRSPAGDTILDLVTTSLADDKAEDIVVIPLAGRSTIGDFMLVASGRSTRQVSAMAEHLIFKLKQSGMGRVNVEGLAQGDWVLIDAGDVIVHLFRPEVREFYGLEKMWTVDPKAMSPAPDPEATVPN